MGKGTHPSCPPLDIKYAHLLQRPPHLSLVQSEECECECELPLIDLHLLTSPNPRIQQECAQQIMEASSQWGFFQAINHGLPPTLIHHLRTHAAKLFSLPFEVKKNEHLPYMNMYMWGTPTGVDQLNNSNWMESFQFPPHSINSHSQSQDSRILMQDIDFTALRVTIEEYGRAIGKIGCEVLDALASQMGLSPRYFSDCYSAADSFIRFNRYPPCTNPWAVHGMEPHTDSDLITLILQDQVGGLQILKDNKWMNVQPNFWADALVINIGDLLQAWSNDFYKSTKHRVAVNCNEDRVSVGYFVFPFGDTLILNPQQDKSGCHYRNFTPKDFKAQVREDIVLTGSKIGLPHFRINNNNVLI